MERLVPIGWFGEGIAPPYEDGVVRDLGRKDGMWFNFEIAMGSFCLVQCHEE